MHSIATLTIVCGSITALNLPLGAQVSDLFFDTVDVNVVNLEVVVTDKDGLPVSGLTRDDFTILEDGQPVQISNFFTVESGVPTSDTLPPEEALVPDGVVPSVGPETQRLQLVIFVDNLTIRPDNRNLIFEQLRRFVLDGLDSEDRVMIVVAGDGVEIAQPFTNDPALLLTTIDHLEKQVGQQVQFDVEYRMLMRSIERASLALPGQSPGLAADSGFDVDTAVGEARGLAREITTVSERRYRMVVSALGALERFIDTLAGMRGRKAILYLSDGLPVNTADSLVQAWMSKYSDWIVQVGEEQLLLELTSLSSLEFDSGTDLGDLVDEATVKQVAFYPISAFARGGTMGVSAEYGDSGTASGGMGSRAAADMEAMNREAALLRMADGTGGVAYTRSTNIQGLLEQVRHDFSTFYSLGFQRPPSSDDVFDENLHRLKVQVEGEGLKIRYRRSYALRDPVDRLEDLTSTALHYGFENNSLGARLEAKETVSVGKNRYRVTVMVAIPFQNLLLLPQEDTHVGQLTLVVAARDAQGRASDFQRVEIPVSVPNNQIQEALSGAAGYPMQLDMKAGQQRVSVGIWDHLARIDSTVNLELEVGSSANATPEPDSIEP